MIEGEPPFTGNSEMEVYGKVTRLYYSCSPSRFPEQCKDFVGQLLKKEPETRLGNLRNGVNDVMAHDWFHGFSWDDLYEGHQPAPYTPPPPVEKPARRDEKIIDLSKVSTSMSDQGYWPCW